MCFEHTGQLVLLHLLPHYFFKVGKKMTKPCVAIRPSYIKKKLFLRSFRFFPLFLVVSVEDVLFQIHIFVH